MTWHRTYRTDRLGSWSKLPDCPVSPRQLAAGVSKLSCGGLVCEDCHNPFARRSSRGPRPRRCENCAYLAKGAADRKRRRAKPVKKPAKPVPPCCADAGQVCPQHKQARQKDREDKRWSTQKSMVDQVFFVFGNGFGLYESDPD